MMSAAQREKGKRGEREVASMIRTLLGIEVNRRVRQHEGDSDIEGIDGWVIEVKRRRQAARGDIRQWWHQAEEQARKAGEGLLPVLFYRLDRHDWRCVWPAEAALGGSGWRGYEWTVEGSPEVWAAVARSLMGAAHA